MRIYKLIGYFLLLLAINNHGFAQMPGTPYLTGHKTAALLTALNCGSATQTGTLAASTVASGVTISVPYSGGNGGSYSAYSISSTGVTGLTASTAAGNLVIGSGNIVFSINGTPSAAGTASFALTLGGQSCSFSGTVIAAPTVVTCNTLQCYPWSYTTGSTTILGSLLKDGVTSTGCQVASTANATNPAQYCNNAFTSLVGTAGKNKAYLANASSNSTYIITFSIPVNNIDIQLLSSAGDFTNYTNGTATFGVSTNNVTYTNPTLTNTGGCVWTAGPGTLTSNGYQTYAGIPTSVTTYRITSGTNFTQLRLTIPYIPNTGGNPNYSNNMSALIGLCNVTF